MHDPTVDHSDETSEEPASLRALPTGLFSMWRRTIGAIVSWPPRIGRGAVAIVRSWTSQWNGAIAYHRTAPEPWAVAGSGDRQAAAALGLRAFVFGMIALAIFTASSRNGWGPGVVAAAGEVLWAGMRFIIIALLMPRGAISRSRLSIAFLAGLLPYAIGVTWLLRLAALGASAALTYRGLAGAGIARGDDRIVIGWAFGGQAAVLASGLLIRAIVALLAMG